MVSGGADISDEAHSGYLDRSTASRRRNGQLILLGASALVVLVLMLQVTDATGLVHLGLTDWRPLLFAYVVWSIALCIRQVMVHGEKGRRALFVLPAALFTLAMVVFPMIFGISLALSDWNLASLTGGRFNGLDNFYQMLRDPFYWNALRNMVFYVLMVLVEYAIAFGLALLLNADIKGRRFFRIAFLLPLMLSPVAVSWMIGKSMMEIRFGPLARLARTLGWSNPQFFTDPWMARFMIEVMDAWTFIPFIMIMLLAGLQALPREVQEAARVDGASAWQGFWQITFPLMLPVSLTAIIIRIIFKLKIADIIINVTSGGPGGASDSVTSFIYRVYRDRSNVGYGTLLAFVYLIIIIVFITVLLNLVSRRMQKIA
ncbi:MAG TPA: sugar ABC transporter permease [Devosia sp.]|nr:sugar ABC transporter permease [Devosia sp.]